jgi:L-threonylcarbamoyladenylate synthase
MAVIGTDILLAEKFLREGEVVAIPTETVYGLAGNALSEASILKIYQVKNRPSFDPLIAHVGSREAAQALVAQWPEKAALLADNFWPGPLTLLLPKKAHVPDLLTSGLERVGVRMPNHPLTLQVLSHLDFPLAAPSANPFGFVSPTSAQHVADQLGAKIPYILDGGPCRLGLESTIVGFEEEMPVVYRLGGLSLEQLEAVVGPVQLKRNKSSNPVAPGMLKSHYSPGKPMVLGDIEANLAKHAGKKIGTLGFTRSFPEAAHSFVLSPSGSLDEAARNLFAVMRAIATSDVDIILAERLPDEGLGRAINDRLERAAV